MAAAGPSVVLWFAGEVDGGVQGAVLEILKRLGAEEIVMEPGFSVRFLVGGRLAVGGARGGFAVEYQEADRQPGDDYSQVGTAPVGELAVWAAEAGRANEVAVASLALAIMRECGALVDFDGLLGPGGSVPGDESESRRREVRRFVESFLGRVFEVGYAMCGEEMRYVHVADAEFLSGWLESEHFHLFGD